MANRSWLASLLLVVLAVSVLTARARTRDRDDERTSTPIKHLVVIFDENVSFDHYFATYPHAQNPAGEPAFHPRDDTPTVNGITPELRTHNPNPAAPFRLDRIQGRGRVNSYRLVHQEAPADAVEARGIYAGNGGSEGA